MAHYSAHVKNDIDLVVFSVTYSGESQVHARGCGHARLAKSNDPDESGILDFCLSENEPYEDWYHVAPCAKSGKGFVCDFGGCIVCSFRG